MAELHRICIYPKDIMRITGRSERYARTLHERIKLYYDKKPHQLLTVYEFSEYSGIELKIVEGYIN